MTRKTLSQLVESTKHSYLTRTILISKRIILNQTDTICEFIACVEKKHKDICLSLARRGRDPLTTVLIRNVWDANEAIESLEKADYDIPEMLNNILKDEEEPYYFCDCIMSIRKVSPKGPPR